LALSGKRFGDTACDAAGFSLRLVMSFSDDWSREAEDLIGGQSIPVTMIRLSNYDSFPVDWEKLDAGVVGPAALVGAEMFDSVRSRLRLIEKNAILKLRHPTRRWR
jgi:predicted helicase